MKILVRHCIDCEQPLPAGPPGGRHRLRCDNCRQAIKAAGKQAVRRCLSCSSTLAFGSRKSYCGRCRPDRTLPAFDPPPGGEAA